MTPMTRQQRIMLIVVGALLAAVVVDRAGLLDRSAPAGSLREAYTEQAQLVERQRALVDSADEWAEANERATEAWRAASSRVLHARSTDLAEQDLHDRVTAEMRSLGISLAAWRTIEQPIQENSSAPLDIHRIELVLEFATPSSDALYRLVDRIEHMHDLWVRAESLDIEGPGIMRLEDASLDVTLRIVAVASLAPVQPRTASAERPESRIEAGGADAT
jgi:hypothetical protein